MLDNDYIKKQAKLFCRSDDCYIHSERKDGGEYETCITGGTRAIVLGIISIIDKVCDLSGRRFMDILDEIRLIKSVSLDITDDTDRKV